MSEPIEGRDALRQRVVARLPSWYSHWAHLVGPALIGIALIAFCLGRVRGFTAVDAVATLAWLAACNALEWNIHRHLLHHRAWAFYDRHTPEHHGIFRDHDMTIRSSRELPLVLIPGYAVIALFLLLAAPAAALALIRPNLGFLFYATGIFYILAYEWMHLLYHLPVPARGWPPPLAALRRHHAAHHDPKLMQEWNFNTTVPMWDAVKATRFRERDCDSAAREPDPL
ncbi:MAG TPA: sterol desaturase family protein [Allosphingosinicella sp.]|nr:sterol desaturase family protein [Allosphingosinicella sp.]